MKRLFSTIVLACLAIGLNAQDAYSLRAKILQCFNESRFVEVIDYSKQALQLYEQADDKYNVAGCYNTIVNGANWIAYPLVESMTVVEAFSGFNAMTGGIVKSQGDGQTRKTSTSWMGQLQTLEPGKGYIYNSKATTTKTLVFPTSAK